MTDIKDEADTSPAIQPAWLSVPDACVYIDCSLRQFYDKIADAVEVRKDGRRSKVGRLSLDRYMASLPRLTKSGLRHARGVDPKAKKKPAKD